MKKIIYTIVIVFLYFPLNGQSYEINISLGSDFYKIKKLSEGFNLVDLTEAKIIRDGFSNPLAYGVGVNYSSSKNYTISFEVDFNYLEYLVKYSRNYPQLTNPFFIKTSNYNIPWVRLGVFVNIDYNIISYRDIEFLLGGGVGLHIFSPVVSAEFLYDTLLDKLIELDVSDDIRLGVFLSQKIRAGIKYKIINSNFNISAISSYSFINNPEYEAPSNYFGIKINIGYAI